MSKCYVWLRNAEEFIGHVASVERGFAVPISIRALSPKGWDGNGGTWTFSVAADKFSDLVFVRLRAANVFVETSDNAAVFSGSLTAPGDIVVPVGRAMSRGGEREPDALGTLTLFNASPIGDWHLQVDEGPAAIENVYVDLMVTAIPKSALESLSDRHRPKS
jgi:hypothetical protein